LTPICSKGIRPVPLAVSLYATHVSIWILRTYPITIGPLSWKLVGDAIQPVKGSDGLTHLAYTLFFTNSWSHPATLKSIEVVDPMKSDAVTGKNQVLTLTNEDVTGQCRILSRPATQDKMNFVAEVPPG
jgi:hypothetical protein